MDRKDFIRKGLMGIGTIVAIPTLNSACVPVDKDGCTLSPKETAGPFPNKTPAQMVKENIVSDRSGIALHINITVKAQSNDCQPLEGAMIDVWQCDSEGQYSEYGSLKNAHFLRGRQTADAQGQVSFVSVYPGWYRGRAPHIHVEVLDSKGTSLRVTQVAFPDDISNLVYTTSSYKGKADTTNTRDGVFRNSLDDNMADNIVGNISDGYTLTKTIVV